MSSKAWKVQTDLIFSSLLKLEEPQLPMKIIFLLDREFATASTVEDPSKKPIILTRFKKK